MTTSLILHSDNNVLKRVPKFTKVLKDIESEQTMYFSRILDLIHMYVDQQWRIFDKRRTKEFVRVEV